MYLGARRKFNLLSGPKSNFGFMVRTILRAHDYLTASEAAAKKTTKLAHMISGAEEDKYKEQVDK